MPALRGHTYPRPIYISHFKSKREIKYGLLLSGLWVDHDNLKHSRLLLWEINPFPIRWPSYRKKRSFAKKHLRWVFKRNNTQTTIGGGFVAHSSNFLAIRWISRAKNPTCWFILNQRRFCTCYWIEKTEIAVSWQLIQNMLSRIPEKCQRFTQVTLCELMKLAAFSIDFPNSGSPSFIRTKCNLLTIRRPGWWGTIRI